METRYVTVPANIEIEVMNPMTGKLVTATRDFESFIKERTNDSGVVGKTLDALLLGLSIRQSFAGCKPGTVIGLVFAEWEMLCTAIRTPTSGYNPEVMFQLLPMVRAVLDAPSTNPSQN